MNSIPNLVLHDEVLIRFLNVAVAAFLVCGIALIVNDPCCGSGRMLLAAAKLQPNWHFVGQDVDLRCVRMTAINLALRNYYGHVVCGNSLSNTSSLIYETGRVQVWGNAIRKVRHVPLPDRAPEEIEMTEPECEVPAPEQSPAVLEMNESTDEKGIQRTKQLRLF